MHWGTPTGAGFVPEVIPSDPSLAPLGHGYGESKYVAERVLEETSK